MEPEPGPAKPPIPPIPAEVQSTEVCVSGVTPELVVLATLVLLATSGSFTELVTLAVFVMLPAALARTVIVAATDRAIEAVRITRRKK